METLKKQLLMTIELTNNLFVNEHLVAPFRNTGDELKALGFDTFVAALGKDDTEVYGDLLAAAMLERAVYSQKILEMVTAEIACDETHRLGLYCITT